MRKQKINELNELIAENGKIIDKNLFKGNFGYDTLSDIRADLYETRNMFLDETKANLIEDKLDRFKIVLSNITTSRFSTKTP